MPTVADFIEEHRETLLRRFVAQASTLPPARGLGREALLHSLPEYLGVLAALSRAETRRDAAPAKQRLEQAHLGERRRLGYDEDAVVQEYVLLGQLITGLWAHLPPEQQPGLADSQRLFEGLRDAMDHARAFFRGESPESTQLQQLFESAPAIVATLRGPEHVFEMVNPRYQESVAPGRPLVGLRLADALPEVAAQGFLSLLDEVFRTGRPYVGREVHLRLDRRGDGQLEDTYFTFVYQPMRDASGRVDAIAVFGFEVTELVVARRQAEAASAQLEAIFQSFPEALYVGDQTGLTRANPAAVHLWGYRTPGELHRSLATLTAQLQPRHADSGAPLAPEDTPFSQALQGRTVSMELQLRHPQTGADRLVRNTSAPVRVGGEVVGAVATDVDITERRRAELALQESEQRLQMVVDAIPALVAFLDPEHRYIFGNAAYGAWFGVDPRTLRGRPIREVIGEESYRRIRPYVERALAGEEVRYESPFVFGGGREGYLQAIYTPQRAADGRVVGYVAIAWDITAQKQAEDELRQRAEFERQLIGIVSHDLRNPLQAIELSTVSLLRRPGLDERAAATIGRIRNTAQRMTRMTRDLLDFTRTRLGGGLPLQCAPMDLNALAHHVVDEVRLAHPGREVGLVEEGQGQGEWDADRLAQVLTNLLNNALTYSPEGTPVRLSTRAEDGHVVLEVHNEGEPIPPEQQGRLFRPFERGDHQGMDAGGSIGLGLFIVDAIVRAHGGHIEVRSREGEGTTFCVRLPRAPVCPTGKPDGSR